MDFYTTDERSTGVNIRLGNSRAGLSHYVAPTSCFGPVLSPTPRRVSRLSNYLVVALANESHSAICKCLLAYVELLPSTHEDRSPEVPHARLAIIPLQTDNVEK